MAAALRYVRFVPLEQHPRWGEPDHDGGRFLVPKLWCPSGHPFDTNMTLQQGNALADCRHQPHTPKHALSGRRQVRCGVTLLLVGGCRTPEGGPAIYYAQVLASEVAALAREGLGPAAMMAWLDRNPYLGEQPLRSA